MNDHNQIVGLGHYRGEWAAFILDPVPPTAFVETASSWRYYAAAAPPGSDWPAPGFDDSPWTPGVASFGFGGDQETTIPCGPSAPACDANNRATTYFRKAFDVTDASLVEALEIEITRNQAAAIYLNGVQIHRDANFPLDPGHDIYASGALLGDRKFTLPVDPALLVDGSNILAVEIHLSSPTDRELHFDLNLLGSVAPIPEPSAAILAVGTMVSVLAIYRRRRKPRP